MNPISWPLKEYGLQRTLNTLSFAYNNVRRLLFIQQIILLNAR